MNKLNDRTNGFQKVFALALLFGAIWGLIRIINPFMGDLKQLLQNTWWCIALGTPLVFLLMYIIKNPLVIWGVFTTISSKLTGWLVKMDPLSVMDRYVDYLKQKRQNLGKTIEVVRGEKTNLDRELTTREKSIEENKRLGMAALKTNNRNRAGVFGEKVKSDQSTITNLQPLQDRAEKSLTFLSTLYDNWGDGIEKLEYEIDGKRREYKIIKTTVKGLKTAEDFINSDNEAARLYGMSVQALENKVSNYIGYIDEFERKSKGKMEDMTIAKQANMDEGLSVIEQYMTDNKLLMPDYSGTEDVSFEEVSASATPKFNLLKNK